MNEKLPDEQFVSTTYRRIRLTVLSVIAILLLFNGVMWYYLKEIDDTDRLTVKWRMLEDLDSPVDLLILGDSSSDVGVDPGFWTNASGESAINLASYGSATVINDAWMLENYLVRFGAPEKVVIVHVYDVWRRDLKHSLMFRVPFKNIWKLRAANFDADFTIRAAFGALFPIYSQDHTVPLLFRRTLPMVLARYASDPKQIKNILHRGSNATGNALPNTGFRPVRKPSPSRVVEDAKNHLDFLRTHEFKLSPINADALQQIITLADQYDVDVYFANSPMYKDLAQDPSFVEYYSDLKATLSEFASKSPRVHLLMDEIVTFSKYSMENVDHVVYTAAQIYTQWLYDKSSGESQQ